MSECRWCASERTAPVLDKRIEKAPTAGNKFRGRCLSCWRWQPMTSKAAWKESESRLILPADADPEQEDNLLTATEYGEQYGDDDVAELVEKVQRQGVAQYVENGQEVAADGGRDVEDVEDVEDDESDESDEESENEFTCPATGCGATVEGFPDCCPTCGVPYNWPENPEDE